MITIRIPIGSSRHEITPIRYLYPGPTTLQNQSDLVEHFSYVMELNDASYFTPQMIQATSEQEKL